MANKRHKPEEIVTKLRQVEAFVGSGIMPLYFELDGITSSIMTIPACVIGSNKGYK